MLHSMRSRRSFFAALAALVVVPKVVKPYRLSDLRVADSVTANIAWRRMRCISIATGTLDSYIQSRGGVDDP